MIYADYNGSAPLLPSVREHLKKRLESDLFANPNAIHSLSQKIAAGMEKCRTLIAEVVGCRPDQLYFNSGSAEGISQIIHSVLSAAPKEKRIIITSAIEHTATATAFSYYTENHAFILKKVDVDANGTIKLETLEKLLNEHQGQVALVSLMAANNETGVMQPYYEVSKLCRAHNVDYFCDTTQLIGKGDFHFIESGVDFAVCSGHKLGAFTGTGFVMAKDAKKLRPLIYGSDTQEKSKRGGTQHYLGIETLAIAMKDYADNKHKLETLSKARLEFEAELKKSFPNVVIIGEKAKRLAGTTLIGYPGIHGQGVQIELETQDIFVTTSSACSDNQPETSKVLRAMGVDDSVGRSVVRISLSYSHGEKEYSSLARSLKAAYTKLSKIHSY